MTGSNKVVQITNIAPQATRDQMQTLFGYLGKIEDIRLYPTIRDVAVPVQSRICYVKFHDPVCVGVAQHMTNTVFIDRALIVVPYQSGEIPDEQRALELTNQGTMVPGLFPVEPKLPPHVTNQLEGLPPNQVVTTHDPRLVANGLPMYPPLPATLDGRRIEEIRRTLLVAGIEASVSTQQLIDFFTNAGEIKYVRFCNREGETDQYALVEFSDQNSIIAALQMNGKDLNGKNIKVYHSTQAIVKPQAKSNEAAQREIEEAMSRVKEAQNLISAAIDPVIGLLAKEKKRSRSGSRSRRSRSPSRGRRRSRSGGRRSRSRSRRRSRNRGRSRSRSRRSRSRSKRSRTRSRDRKRRSRSSGRRRRTHSRSRSHSRRRSRSRSRRSHSKSKSKSSSKAHDKSRDKKDRKDDKKDRKDDKKDEKDKREDEPKQDEGNKGDMEGKLGEVTGENEALGGNMPQTIEVRRDVEPDKDAEKSKDKIKDKSRDKISREKSKSSRGSSRSPSKSRHRSPSRRKSRSPGRKKSRSPSRRKSPHSRRKSHSPSRRRSGSRSRRRSKSPSRGSHNKHSPSRRRSRSRSRSRREGDRKREKDKIHDSERKERDSDRRKRDKKESIDRDSEKNSTTKVPRNYDEEEEGFDAGEKDRSDQSDGEGSNMEEDRMASDDHGNTEDMDISTSP
ncbi:hypothetical protein L9F63_013392 [Diploptera punctata]|uniref:RRM domain-containing protein n=1 Tax=Diploptera punctata TaxID=6984 RepID=A0AAD8EM79_DIPPU|nr:hypothetical protein L9F63_013392 [Diploptera punctata]